MEYVLGIDLGTTAIKVAVFDNKGSQLASSTNEYQLITPSALIVEQEAEVYWQAFKSCLADTLKIAAINPHNIASLAISAQGETLFFLDENGKPLRNAIVWMDNRAQEESDIIEAEFTNEAIHKTTGQVSMVATWPAAKILWLKRNEPDIFAKTAKFLLIEDYFIYRMTGKFVSEGSLLCSTILWDINTKDYWPEMLKYLEIDRKQLPDILEPGSPVAGLCDNVAAELGLKPGMMVALGALDQACGAIGVGNVHPGIFSESTGAALASVTISDKPVFDENREMPCFYSGIPNLYMIHSFSTGGMAVRWYRDSFCAEEMGIERLGGGNSYNIIDAEASGISPGSEGLVVLPHLQGSGPPDSNQFAKGVIYGITLRHTKAHFARAIMEGVTMVLCRMIEATKAMRVEIKEIRSLSGGAKSKFWCQMKADASGIPVRTMKNTESAACLGAAILAGIATGFWSSASEAVNTIIEQDKEFKPNVLNKPAYDKLLRDHKRIFKDLNGAFRDV